MNLRDHAIGNLENILSQFIEQKMTNKLRVEIAREMAIIANNAFSLGYSARAEEEGTELDEAYLPDTRRFREALSDITWRVHQAIGGAA